MRPENQPAKALSLDEVLREQFYAWEQRGRGWPVFEYPVLLEPAFRPFVGHYAAVEKQTSDARRPSFFGRFFETLRGGPARENQLEPQIGKEPEEPESEPFLYDTPLVEMEVVLPSDLKISRDRAGRLLSQIATGYDPVAFELIGLPDSVSLQIACAEGDRAQLYQQIPAYFPDLVLRDRFSFLDEQWQSAGPETAIVEFGLSREFMLPLRTVRDFDVDPLIPVIASLSELVRDEIGLMQVLFERVRNPWAESILRAVTDDEGHAFFVDAPETLALAREKTAQPLFACVLRIATRAKDQLRAWHIARSLGAAITQFADPRGNEFIPLANDGYSDTDHAGDVLSRLSRRPGMLLNLDEIVSMVHFPSSSVRSPKFRRIDRRTKEAPAAVIGHRLELGENHHAGRTAKVSLSAAQRVRHTYVIGASGTGKSTLLLQMILQGIEQGEGMAVFDPHGDLIDEILLRVPEGRWNDVVLLNPADEEYAVGFNILDAHSDLEKTLLSSDLVAVFRRLSTSWGDQMTSVLGNGILAFLESNRGGTLSDLRRFLVDAEYRASFLSTVRDPEIVYYWQHEFPLLSGRPQAPILTRLDTFLRPGLVRHMVVQKENRLDFASIMNTGRILLAKLAQGAIGEENSYLLGSLLVSKFHQLALARQELRAGERREFYLYIDEFHNFVTPSLASILSGARKYGIGLVLAHQELRQLASRDADVASAVLSNPCTRVCFRVGDADAKRLEDGFSSFDAKDLQNLGTGEAICRVERADFDFNLRTAMLPAIAEGGSDRVKKITDLSRSRYAKRRDEIELVLARPTAGEVPKPETKLASEKTEGRTRTSNGGKTAQPSTETQGSAPRPGRGGRPP
jgi:hypothetical protein